MTYPTNNYYGSNYPSSSYAYPYSSSGSTDPYQADPMQQAIDSNPYSAAISNMPMNYQMAMASNPAMSIPMTQPAPKKKSGGLFGAILGGILDTPGAMLKSFLQPKNLIKGLALGAAAIFFPPAAPFILGYGAFEAGKGFFSGATAVYQGMQAGDYDAVRAGVTGMASSAASGWLLKKGTQAGLSKASDEELAALSKDGKWELHRDGDGKLMVTTAKGTRKFSMMDSLRVQPRMMKQSLSEFKSGNFSLNPLSWLNKESSAEAEALMEEAPKRRLLRPKTWFRRGAKAAKDPNRFKIRYIFNPTYLLAHIDDVMRIAAGAKALKFAFDKINGHPIVQAGVSGLKEDGSFTARLTEMSTRVRATAGTHYGKVNLGKTGTGNMSLWDEIRYALKKDNHTPPTPGTPAGAPVTTVGSLDAHGVFTPGAGDMVKIVDGTHTYYVPRQGAFHQIKDILLGGKDDAAGNHIDGTGLSDYLSGKYQVTKKSPMSERAIAKLPYGEYLLGWMHAPELIGNTARESFFGKGNPASATYEPAVIRAEGTNSLAHAAQIVGDIGRAAAAWKAFRTGMPALKRGVNGLTGRDGGLFGAGSLDREGIQTGMSHGLPTAIQPDLSNLMQQPMALSQFGMGLPATMQPDPNSLMMPQLGMA